MYVAEINGQSVLTTLSSCAYMLSATRPCSTLLLGMYKGFRISADAGVHALAAGVFHAEAAAELSRRRTKAGLPEAAAQQDAEEDGQPAEQHLAAEADVFLGMQAQAPALPAGTQPQAAQQAAAALGQKQQARPAQATAAALPAGTQQQAAATPVPQQARLPQAAAAALAAGTQQHATQLAPAVPAVLLAGVQQQAPAVPAVLPAGVQQQAAAAPVPQQARLPQAAVAALAAGTQQHTTQEAYQGLRAGVPLAVARGRLPLQPCGSWASGNTGPAVPTCSDDEDCDTMPTSKRARVV